MTEPDIYTQVSKANNDLKLMALAEKLTDKEWHELTNSPTVIQQLVRGKPMEFLKLAFWAERGDLAHCSFSYYSTEKEFFKLPVDIIEAQWKKTKPEDIKPGFLKNTIIFMGWNRGPYATPLGKPSRSFPQEVALLRLINQQIGHPLKREKTPFDQLLQEAFNGLVGNAIPQIQQREGKSVLKALVRGEDFYQGGQSVWASERATKLAEAFYHSRLNNFSLFFELGKTFEDFAQVPQHLTHKKYMQLLRNGLKEGYTPYSLNNIIALHDLKEDIFKQSDYKKVIVYYANNRWDDSTTPVHLEKMWNKLELDQQKAFAKSLVQQAPYVLETLVDFIDEKIIVGAWADFFQSRLDKTPKCQRLWQKHIILDEVQEKIDAKTVQKRKM